MIGNITQHAQDPTVINPMEGSEYLKYYFRVVRGIAKRQNLDLSAVSISYNRSFVFTQDLKNRWKDLFKTPSNSQPDFHTYYSYLGRNFLFKALQKLNANFANLQHLGADIEFEKPERGFCPGEAYFLKSKFIDICLLSHDRAILCFRTLVFREEGSPLLKHHDYMFLSNIDLHSAAILSSKTDHSKFDEVRSSFVGLSKKNSQLNWENCQLRERFRIPGNTGFLYGQLSGDLNPIHTNSTFARLLGHQRSFVQGLFTTNLILSRLLDGDSGLSKISIRFCKPGYTKSVFKLLSLNNRFEIVDHRKRLVAQGFTES